MTSDSNLPTSTSIWARLTATWHWLRAKWWRRWAIDLAAFATVFVAVSTYQARDLVDTGEVIPETTLASADGEVRSIVDPEADRTLVYAWAPWCGVCSAQEGTLSRAIPWFGDDVAVRSVVFDFGSRDDVRTSAKDKSFPVLFGTRRLRRELNVNAFPTMYVLSKKGRVLSRSKGYTTTAGLLWRVWW